MLYSILFNLFIFSFIQAYKNFGSSFKYSKKFSINNDKFEMTVDLNRLLEICKETTVCGPAVLQANKWLHNSDSLTSRGVTSVIQIFGYAGLIDDAISALEIAEKRGIKLNTYHYNACINICKNHKKYDYALDLYSTMKNKLISPDVKTYSIIIQILGAIKSWEESYKIFNQIDVKQRDGMLYSSILSALEKSLRSDECLHIWNEMKSKRTECLSPYTLNTVLSCLGKSGQWKQALDLFEEEKMYADKITYHTIANILKISGEAEKMELVKINNLTVIEHEYANITRSKSSVSFDKLIRDAKRTGNFKNAKIAADSWLTSQYNLSPGGLTACISIFGFAKALDSLELLLEKVIEKNVVLNTKQINTLLSAFNRCELETISLAIFNKMKTDSFINSINIETFPIIESKENRFISLIEKMSFNLNRDQYTYGIILKTLEKLNQWQVAYDIFKNIPSKRHGPEFLIERNLVMYNTILSSLSKAGKWENALKIYDQLLDENSFEPDTTSKFLVENVLLKTKLLSIDKDVEFKDETWFESIGKGIYSKQANLEDKILFDENNNIDVSIKALNFVGRFKGVLKLFDKIESSGFDLKDSHYNSAIKACGDIGNWSDCLEILNHMKEKGIIPSSLTYDLILDILWQFSGDKNLIRKYEDEAKKVAI